MAESRTKLVTALAGSGVRAEQIESFRVGDDVISWIRIDRKSVV